MSERVNGCALVGWGQQQRPGLGGDPARSLEQDRPWESPTRTPFLLPWKKTPGETLCGSLEGAEPREGEACSPLHLSPAPASPA